MLKIPEELQENLKCIICKNIISCSPVFSSKNKENVCGRCQIPKGRGAFVRNKLFESIASLFTFQCKNSNNGCFEILRWGESLEHEKECLVKMPAVGCPSLPKGDCKWKGNTDDILMHFQEQHPKLIVVQPYQFTMDFKWIKDQESKNIALRNMLMQVDGFIFLLMIKVNVFEKKIYINVSLIDDINYKLFFDYHVEVNNSDHFFKGNNIKVVPVSVGLTELDETKSTSIVPSYCNTCGFVITVTINSAAVKCTNCSKITTEIAKIKAGNFCCDKYNFIRRDKTLTCLQRCVFDKEGCKYLDGEKLLTADQCCEYTGIPENLSKHQVLFCRYFVGGKCSDCKFFVRKTQVSIFEHQLKVHYKKIYHNKIIVQNGRIQIGDIERATLQVGESKFICKWAITIDPQANLALGIMILSNLPSLEDKNVILEVNFQSASNNTKTTMKRQLSEPFHNRVEEWAAYVNIMPNWIRTGGILTYSLKIECAMLRPSFTAL